MKYLILLLSSIVAISCSDVKPIPKDIQQTDINEFRKVQTQYVKDQSANIFLEEPWYVYDEANHIIWPVFKVYSLKTSIGYYQFQIVDYYNKQNVPGNYKIRMKSESGNTFIWSFNAQGCGNVYTNPDFDQCMQNPKTNVYTYLNLANLKTQKMSEEQAKKSLDWHIAFNGTEVKINSGIDGPGQSRIAHLYTYSRFFIGQDVDFQELSQEAFTNKGERFFNLKFNLKKARYFLPRGVPRVINEPDWLDTSKQNKDLFTANSQNWWIVKNGEKDTFSKINFAKIEETLNENDIVQTKMTINYFYQGPSDEKFASNYLTWELPAFDNQDRVYKFCLDFDSQSIISCNDSHWDLRFSALNRGLKRRWRFNIHEGAQGPFSVDEVNEITSGRESN